MDRGRRLAVHRRTQDRSTLPRRRLGGAGHRCLPDWPHHNGLSTRTSAWLLLGYVDGGSCALSANPRPAEDNLEAEDDDIALSRAAARSPHPPIQLGDPVQYRKWRN